MPLNAFKNPNKYGRPQTLEGGGGGKSPTPPAAPAASPPPQTAKAPSSQVYKERNQAAGKGGMSAGYQSTLLTGVGGVQNDSIAGALANRNLPRQSGGVFTNNTLG